MNGDVTFPKVAGLPDILAYSRMFKVSAALNTAAKLDLFTTLSHHPQGATLGELVSAVGLCPSPGFRGLVDWLDLLVSVGCLTRTGEGDEARYDNTEVAGTYLVRGRPQYMGGILSLNADRSYPMLGHLPHVLRHGAMPPESQSRIPDIRSVFGSDEEAAAFFADGMTGASLGNFTLLAQKFPFARFRSLGDLGGSSGVLCCAVVRQHPHMTAVSYDLPPVRQAAERYVAAQGCQDRVQVADLDFFSPDPLPPGPRHDVLTLGMVLHDWGLDKKMLLLRKAHAALPPGGALISVDHLIDDARSHSPLQLGMSLTMACEFGAAENAFDYSYKEFVGWATEVGFSSFELIELVGTAKAAVAYK